jgi:hypothetical protein
MSRSPLNRPNERGNVGSGWPITRRRLLIAIGACLWGAGHHTNAQANKSDGPQVGDLAGDLLAWAAQQVQSLKRVRFKIHYEKGSTTLYRKIKMRKVEGAVVRPDRMKATAEAKLGFLGVDVHATMIGEHVWVESFRIDDEFDVEPGMALLVNDPIRYAPAAAAAIENPMVTRVEGGTIWIEGKFNSALLEDTELSTFAGELEVRPVEIGIDQSGRVVSVKMAGPFVGHDEENVVRRIEFFGFDDDITIDQP